jgi:2TM domain
VRRTDPGLEAAKPTVTIGRSEASARTRFAIDLVIFLAVNVTLLMACLVLFALGVPFRGLWVWPIVVVLWAVRLGLEGRVAYATRKRRRSNTEEQIQRELRRMS